MDTTLITQTIEGIKTCDDHLIIEPFTIGPDAWENELLLFVKPEVFSGKRLEHSERTLALILQKIQEFECTLDGMMIVGGKLLQQLGIMDRHYGLIDRLSKNASKMVTEDDLQKMTKALGLASDIHDYDILGGHEYLERYPDENPFSLDALWLSKERVKLRSGFYLQTYEQEGDNIILVNGFHPVHLLHYTEPSHRIVVMLAHSNTKWQILKDEMVGATFPEKAISSSIRGALYAQPERFGFEEMNISCNSIHLSAGPFEAMFEIVNFLEKILGLDLQQQPPLVLKTMLEDDRSLQNDIANALEVLDNPTVITSPKPTDLFTATENMDTHEAVDFWKRHRH